MPFLARRVGAYRCYSFGRKMTSVRHVQLQSYELGMTSDFFSIFLLPNSDKAVLLRFRLMVDDQEREPRYMGTPKGQPVRPEISQAKGS
jgi:hypothetical protein